MPFPASKVQKLHIFPPKIVFIEVHFGSEKILGLKKFWGRTKFGVPKKNFESENNLGREKL